MKAGKLKADWVGREVKGAETYSGIMCVVNHLTSKTRGKQVFSHISQVFVYFQYFSYKEGKLNLLPSSPQSTTLFLQDLSFSLKKNVFVKVFSAY